MSRPSRGSFGTLLGAGLIVVLLCASSVSWGGPARDDPPGTRAGPGYSGSFDGDGKGNDLCLAGHRYYTFSFNFADASNVTLNYINISKVNVDPPIISTPFISYSVASGEAKRLGDLEASVRNGLMVTNKSLLVMFSVEVLFHLNWSDAHTKIKLVPYLDYGNGPVQLQPIDEAPLNVWGRLDKPIVDNITDESGRRLSNEDVVRSNSTITLEDISFIYWHSSEDLSGYSPMPGEIKPYLTDGTMNHEPVPGERIAFSIKAPVKSQGEWEFAMGLNDIYQDGWSIRVQMWMMNLKVDGYGPTFELITPSGKVAQGYVNWTMAVNEKPSSAQFEVNGSTIMIRLRPDVGDWSDWQNVGIPEKANVVTVKGSSNLSLDGYRHIQFKATDMVGNEAESISYEIPLNHPPRLSIPQEYANLTLKTDQSLHLNGLNFTVDEDEDVAKLRYNWTFGGDYLGTGSIINKPLFGEAEGEYAITLTVTDTYEATSSITFSIIVEKAAPPKEDHWIVKLLKDPVFQVLGSSILGVIVIILIAVLIVVIVKRFGRTDEDDSDFVISEDANRNNEEFVTRIKDMYAGNFAFVGPDGSASAFEDVSGDEFDFDYNLYEVLGLENGASGDEIRSAYRKMASQFHPDRIMHAKGADPDEAREMMVRVNKAKEFLMNPERKARYDEHLSEIDFSIET